MLFHKQFESLKFGVSESKVQTLYSLCGIHSKISNLLSFFGIISQSILNYYNTHDYNEVFDEFE